MPTRHFPTPSLVSFTGIQSKDIPIIWGSVKGFIELGLAEGELLETILSRLLKTECQLWVAYDSEAVIAACVTEIVTLNHRKVCNVISCGGTRMNEWLDISLPAIEGWANAHGATMRFPEIRRGWAQVLKKHGYKITKITMEKVS